MDNKGPSCLYTDIGKRIRDLLYDEEDHSSSTAHGVGIAITSQRGCFFSAVANAHILHKMKNFKANLRLDTRCDHNLLTITTVNEPSPGFKGFYSLTILGPQPSRVQLQYHNYYALINTSIVGGFTTSPIFNYSGVFGSKFLALSTKVSFDTETENFNKCDARLRMANKDRVISVILNDKGVSLKASYYWINRLTNRAYGAKMAFNLLTGQGKIIAGAQYPLNPLTTLRLRVNSAGKASARIKHRLTLDLTLTILGETDVCNVCKNSKFGLALSIKTRAK